MKQLVVDASLHEHISIDSAGTSAFHAGEPADARSRQAAEARGIDLTSISRQFVPEDFERFDYIIAMDRHNLAHILRMAGDQAARERVHLLRSFDPDASDDRDVPDPYYGGVHGFQRVLDICAAGCRGLLAHIRERHGI